MNTKKLFFPFQLTNTLFLLVTCLISLTLLTSCSKQKSKEQMSHQELRQKVFALLDETKYEKAADMLEHIISKSPDHPEISKYKILLADAYFQLGRYPSAFQMYEHFNQYFPANKKAEYAKYRSVLSKFYLTLKTDCDQTSTIDTIKLCREYNAFNSYNKYKRDVFDIQNTCEHKLINKEVYIYNFYLKKGEYNAAKNRLKYLRDNYLQDKKNIEPRLLYLECKLAKKQKNTKNIHKSLKPLINKYPESQFTRMAQAMFTKDQFTF